MATRRTALAERPSTIVRSLAYGKMTKGDAVRVQGERGEWEFRSHCVNTQTGSEWLDVFGGEPGYETLRAFRIDRVRPAPKRRARHVTGAVLTGAVLLAGGSSAGAATLGDRVGQPGHQRFQPHCRVTEIIDPHDGHVIGHVTQCVVRRG